MASEGEPALALSSDTIETVPEAGRNISHEGKDYTTIKEGLAYILVPRGTPTSMDPKMSKEDSQRQQVFYNPIQQFNRDLSVLAIKTFGEDFVARKRQKHEVASKKSNGRKKRKLQEKETDDQQAKLIDMLRLPLKKTRTEGTDKPEALTDIAAEDASEEREITAHPTPEISADGNTNLHGLVSSDKPIESSNGIGAYTPQFRILDALSATGLRALRYAKEIPFVTSITANDLSSSATDSITLNVKYNRLEEKITANTGNAIAYMYSFVEKTGYEVIDLDPYGTAAPFIDASIQAINDGGLLCVTCTDSAIFASHGYLEKTYSQYGGLPFKGEPCHEGGLRLILHAVASSAARYGMAIEPLLSLSIDYYIRVFVRIRKAPNDVKLLAGKTMIIYHCQNGCGSWSTQFLARNKPTQNKNGAASYKHSFAQGPSANQLCEHCGIKTHLSGPMYGGPLHNPEFIKRMLAHIHKTEHDVYATKDRMEGMLHTALEEITFGVGSRKTASSGDAAPLDPFIPRGDPAEIDHSPFFFIPSSVAKVIHCQSPPLAAVRGALRSAGFRVTMSHCKPGSIRTDASWTDIWHIMLEWCRQKAPLKKPLKKEIPGYAIMAKATAHQAGDARTNGESSRDVVMAEAADASSVGVTDPEVDAGNEDATGPTKAKQEEIPPSYLSANYEVVFNEALGRDHDRGKYVRYQLAPRENWGPMSRAKITK
ncbi:S-adenosyl-L-methionine-dependent methyltransferase [Clohesyomyces aquaticus]|uniref:tRNA (guanine(26)-N(2))-dimethyltransferase n=1 Tax=Clohesyomyces aquaticus TaxID=1231657 RepID=A0A1Y2A6U2_9PLEO|nr:S-adenosyl-L-methionine-dependent methyltransferase [Clohesyomyces aquaticus]